MAKSSKEFLQGLAELAESLRRQVDADTEGWDISTEAISERRRQVCDDVSGFEFFDRHYFPHYGKAEPSELHKYLYKRLPEIVNSGGGQRDALAAPRGEAKSTKISLVFVLWCVVRLPRSRRWLDRRHHRPGRREPQRRAPAVGRCQHREPELGGLHGSL